MAKLILIIMELLQMLMETGIVKMVRWTLMQMTYYIHHRAGIISEVERYRKVRRQYSGTVMAGGISEQMARLILIKTQ